MRVQWRELGLVFTKQAFSVWLLLGGFLSSWLLARMKEAWTSLLWPAATVEPPPFAQRVAQFRYDVPARLPSEPRISDVMAVQHEMCPAHVTLIAWPVMNDRLTQKRYCEDQTCWLHHSSLCLSTRSQSVRVARGTDLWSRMFFYYNFKRDEFYEPLSQTQQRRDGFQYDQE